MTKIQLTSVLVFIVIFIPFIRAQSEKNNIDMNINEHIPKKLFSGHSINDEQEIIIDHQIPEMYTPEMTEFPDIFDHTKVKDSFLISAKNKEYDRDTITIYADHDNGLFGRSLYRTFLMVTRTDLFRRTDTYYVDKEVGSYLTAVILDAKTVALLEKKMLGKQSLYLGVYEISLDTMLINTSKLSKIQNTIYKFKNNALQLNTSFSIEKVPQELIEIIEQYYTNDSSIRKLVTDYYRSNFIIRIHSAENFIDPWNHVISMNEALVMATYLGDIEQPLWGMANGNANLINALSVLEKG